MTFKKVINENLEKVDFVYAASHIYMYHRKNGKNFRKCRMV